jgi:SAM-dependent methyltransferase
LADDPRLRLRPSSNLLRIVARLSESPRGSILDAPCGYGRNAKLIAALGFPVVCLDAAAAALRAVLDPRYSLWLPPTYSHLEFAPALGPLRAVRADLLASALPFAANTFAGIVNVHFTVPALLQEFARVLMPGGFVFLETVSAQGGNYKELPAPGELRAGLPQALRLEEYQERPVGPPGARAATVKLLAIKF